jgi:hypothetical protein
MSVFEQMHEDMSKPGYEVWADGKKKEHVHSTRERDAAVQRYVKRNHKRVSVVTCTPGRKRVERKTTETWVNGVKQ